MSTLQQIIETNNTQILSAVELALEKHLLIIKTQLIQTLAEKYLFDADEAIDLFSKYESDNQTKKLKKKATTQKGALCSKTGAEYEKQIYKVLKNSSINERPFNTQTEKDLGGSSARNDIECNFKTEQDIGIEVKKKGTPDWMQCKLQYNNETKKWETGEKGKIPKQARSLFNKLINNINLFSGEIPPFMKHSITHEEWLIIKKSTNQWKDHYIDVPNDTIQKLYMAKNCQYIQISDDYGLYSLGKDPCSFNVPELNVEQRLRIRTKIHRSKNKKGFCNLSVTAACQPKNIKSLTKSQYSLDNKDKLPPKLVYNSNQ